jgi:hypothetical protein
VATACALATRPNTIPIRHSPNASPGPVHLPAPNNHSFFVSFIRVSSFFFGAPRRVHLSLRRNPCQVNIQAHPASVTAAASSNRHSTAERNGWRFMCGIVPFASSSSSLPQRTLGGGPKKIGKTICAFPFSIHFALNILSLTKFKKMICALAAHFVSLFSITYA